MNSEDIHAKGFDMFSKHVETPQTDFNSIKVGVKKLEDATLNLESLKKVNRDFGNKIYVLQALANKDLDALREISEFFFRTNGIYQRVCCYFATMYRYDWYIVPEVYTKKFNTEKIKEDFYETLRYLDDS